MKERLKTSSTLLVVILAAVSSGHERHIRSSQPSLADQVRIARTGPIEVPGGPYIPVSVKTRTTSPAAQVVRGRHVSIQVNVDAEGNNIVGDAANEPSIAVDPTDPTRMAIGWRQFDTVESSFRQAGYGYSTDGGLGWTFPGVLEPGVFGSDPVLDSDADGNFYYDRLEIDSQSGDYTCHVFTSTDQGASWGPPVFAFGGDKEWMCVDRGAGTGRGHLYQMWSRGQFNRSVDGAASFEAPMLISPEPFWGTTAVGPDGVVYVAGLEPDAFVVARSTTVRDPSTPMAFDGVAEVDLGGHYEFGGGPNPGGLWGQVWVAVDQSGGPNHGNVYLACSVCPPDLYVPDVKFARSTDGGITWSDPVRVNDDPVDSRAFHWFATMAVSPDGRLDIVWNDTRSDPGGTESELYHAFSWDAGESWSVNEPISPPFDPHLGWPGEDHKLGDYYDMVSDELGVRIAYAATFNGEQDIYYLRLSDRDCNSNGIDDAEDIASGQARDCTGSGIPDRCEIAAGTATDIDGNGVPDECQAPRRPRGRIGR